MTFLLKSAAKITFIFCLWVPISQASETVKGAKKDFEQFKHKLSTELDSAEAKIIELKNKAKSQGNQTQEKLAQDLETAKNEIRKQQAELKYESHSNWKQLKKSLSEATDNLSKKIQSALKD